MNKKLFLLIPACLLVLAACTPKQGGSGAGSSGETSGDTSSGGGSSEREHVNYGSAEAPLNLATLVQEVSKLGLADYEYSPQHFFIRATLPEELDLTPTEGRFSFVWTEETLNMKVNNVTPEQGKTRDDYMPGDVAVIEGYVRYRETGYGPTNYYMTYNSAQGVQNPAPSVVSCQEATRPAVTGITVDAESALSIRQGDTKQLTASIQPKYARGTVQWSVERLNDAVEGKLTCVNGLVTAAADATVGNQYKVIAAVAETTFKAEVTFTIASNAAPKEYTSLVKYDLSSWDKGNNASSYDGWTWGLSAEHALQIFDGTEDVVSTGTPCVTAVSGTKYYACPADQGPGKGIKLGSSSAAGYIQLTTSKDIAKIVFSIKAWSASKLAEISFNDESVGTLVEADATTPKEFTVEFAETKSLKISSSIYSCLVGVELFELKAAE